ncbi:MAG TPA: hypothetical protein VGY56_13345 [Verrucomicrobiae bacterium]|nr:hypothetical protein [Verrucomicrobiae bacterium]
MSAESPESVHDGKWSWLRWTTAVAIVFAAHVVLIFVFGARKNVAPVPVRNAPSFALVDESAGDWLALNNATLFALPGNDGFAASMWTELPPLDIHHKPWTEEPQWLRPSNTLQMAGLFAPFNRFVETNHFARVHFEFNLPPEVSVPASPTQPPIAQLSTLRIEGALAGRSLLTPVRLPSWQDSDIDAPSIVQVLVNAAGNVVSAVLLPQEALSPGNSWEPALTHNRQADQWAVQLARTLRFVPLPDEDAGQPGSANSPTTQTSASLARVAIGRLVFDWQTAPQADTNVSNF